MTQYSLFPPGWPRPKGYSNGMCAAGRLVVTAGVVGWNERQVFVADTLAGQFAQALSNIAVSYTHLTLPTKRIV